jgi:hypothetical protein
MSNYCIISRHIAIISVNIYYEIQNEAGNQDNQDKFKKSFIKFIMSYIKNIKFTETIAERLFYSICTFDLAYNDYIGGDEPTDFYDDNEEHEYVFNNFTHKELKRLNLSVKNYYLINAMNNNSSINNSFNFINYIFASTIPTKYLLDFEMEENDCTICNWHGYDSAWPEKNKRGKFYYSIPFKLNEPVCHFCVTGDYTENNSDDEIIHARTKEEELKYLKENDLVKCGNCHDIWDGFAQCRCYANTDCYIYYDSYTNDNRQVQDPVQEPVQEPVQDQVQDPVQEKECVRSSPPSRPLMEIYTNNIIKILKKENMTLKEENRVLVEKFASLKLKLKELVRD